MPDIAVLPRFDDEALDALAEQLIDVPDSLVEPLAALIADYRSLRDAVMAAGGHPAEGVAHDHVTVDDAQIVLDAAEWLRTLWQVGYMGAGSFPAPPRSDFPAVEIEDILKSALFSRIRHGRQPLPFPPPTRHGVPWHEAVEAPGPFVVAAEPVADDDGQVLAVIIEGCAEWQVVRRDDAGLVVQHAGKGPHYRLHSGAGGAGAPAEVARLERLPPVQTVPLQRRERAGLISYGFAWPQADGRCQSVALRATTPERAEAAAQNWLALRFPERYGQIRFCAGEPA